MPKFSIQQGYSKQSEFDIPEGVLIVGRDDCCDFVIPEADMSRQHLRVIREDGGVFVEDCDSRNGTYLNSVRLVGRQLLKHMDVIQMGRNVLLFNDANAPVRYESSDTAETFTLPFVKTLVAKVQHNIEQVFLGKSTMVRNLLVAILADGHVLIEDAPGLGKSMVAQAVARSIQGVYKRIQFTPDMLPSDVTGISVFDNNLSEFRFVPGPIFGNIILADEINRTTPRTQSSLLECMSDARVTIDGRPHVLSKPFFVIATQNPVEFHGTYPLPEAQLDRFLMRLTVGYPDEDVERRILDVQMRGEPLSGISCVVPAMDIVQCQALVRQVHISDPVKDFIIGIVRATREHAALRMGCSPRASVALMRAGQALAACFGRDFVLPKDIRELAGPVLAHRLSLRVRAQSDWDGPEDVIRDILDQVPIREEESFQ